MFNFFKDETPDLQFTDKTRIVYPHYPPVLAKDLKPLKKHQEEKYNEYLLPKCPGIHDYSRLGYIIPAWSKFHIKANKAGSFAFVGSAHEPGRATPIGQPRTMDVTIVDGAVEFQDGISPSIWNFPGAWALHGKGNVSALVLPAFYHSDFLDDLFVYPGIVDYKGFTTINFVCAPKRQCEIVINAGDPVLHVIPFITNKDFVASYGPATDRQNDASRVVKWFHELNFYRKYYMIRKKFKLYEKGSK